MIEMPCKSQSTGCLFRNFSLMDMFEVLNIKDSIAKNLFITKIDLKSALANFNGKSFFEIFLKEPDYLQMIA